MEHGQGYDAKNMMHTIRLMEVAKDLLVHGTLIIKRSNRQELLDIKSGKWTYEQLCSQVEDMRIEIKELYSKSTLPDSLNMKSLSDLLVQIREVLYG